MRVPRRVLRSRPTEGRWPGAGYACSTSNGGAQVSGEAGSDPPHWAIPLRAFVVWRGPLRTRGGRPYRLCYFGQRPYSEVELRAAARAGVRQDGDRAIGMPSHPPGRTARGCRPVIEALSEETHAGPRLGFGRTDRSTASALMSLEWRREGGAWPPLLQALLAAATCGGGAAGRGGRWASERSAAGSDMLTTAAHAAGGGAGGWDSELGPATKAVFGRPRGGEPCRRFVSRAASPRRGVARAAGSSGPRALRAGALGYYRRARVVLVVRVCTTPGGRIALPAGGGRYDDSPGEVRPRPARCGVHAGTCRRGHVALRRGGAGQVSPTQTE